LFCFHCVLLAAQTIVEIAHEWPQLSIHPR
jgi:hypothetical protein